MRRTVLLLHALDPRLHPVHLLMLRRHCPLQRLDPPLVLLPLRVEVLAGELFLLEDGADALELLFVYHVALGQYVDVRQLELDHGGEGQQGAGDELGGVRCECGVDEVHATQADAPRLDRIGQRAHDRHVRVELDLARAVEKEVLVVAVLVQLVFEPLQVLEEVFHAIEEAAVRPELEFLHDVVQGDQLAHVGSAAAGEAGEAGEEAWCPAQCV